MVKEKYSRIKKRYGLPNYEELERYFRLDKIEDDAYWKLEVLQKIRDKLSEIIKFLGQYLITDHDYKIMVEIEAFDDNDFNKIRNLLKKISITYNKINMLCMLNDIDEKEFAELVTEGLEVFKSSQEIIKELTNKINQHWSKYETNKADEVEKHYLG